LGYELHLLNVAFRKPEGANFRMNMTGGSSISSLIVPGAYHAAIFPIADATRAFMESMENPYASKGTYE
jgi:hypothetical protein